MPGSSVVQGVHNPASVQLSLALWSIPISYWADFPAPNLFALPDISTLLATRNLKVRAGFALANCDT